MVNFGIVGIGFMGVTHYKAIQKIRGARVGAIVSRDVQKRKGDWRNIEGNFGGGGGKHDLGKVRAYKGLDEMLEDPDIDVVDICLPTSMHVETARRALQAGKHVFLEKPIALTLSDANKLVSESKRYRRFLMVAHVLRFFPEFSLIKKLVKSKEYGSIKAAHFKRIISRPSWSGVDDLNRTGGPAIDLHIHDTDFIQFIFGIPDSVVSQGTLGKGKLVEYIHTLYKYSKNISVSAEGGWIGQPGCPFEHGYDIYFEGATLKFNSSSGQSPQLLTSDGRIKKPKLSQVDGFVGELKEVTEAISKNRNSKDLNAISARNSLDICLKEIRSVYQCRRVSI